MDQLNWELLTEVQGRWEADIIKAYLAGHGIDSELFQESLGSSSFPTMLDILGRVQIFIEKANKKKADKLMKAYFEPEEEEKPVKKKVTSKTSAKNPVRKTTSKSPAKKVVATKKRDSHL